MSDPSPRYVLSAGGFDIYDRWYCFDEVYMSPRYAGKTPGESSYGNVLIAREKVSRALDNLNAAHETWLSEDTEARKGKGSR